MSAELAQHVGDTLEAPAAAGEPRIEGSYLPFATLSGYLDVAVTLVKQQGLPRVDAPLDGWDISVSPQEAADHLHVAFTGPQLVLRLSTRKGEVVLTNDGKAPRTSGALLERWEQTARLRKEIGPTVDTLMRLAILPDAYDVPTQALAGGKNWAAFDRTWNGLVDDGYLDTSMRRTSTAWRFVATAAAAGVLASCAPLVGTPFPFSHTPSPDATVYFSPTAAVILPTAAPTRELYGNISVDCIPDAGPSGKWYDHLNQAQRADLAQKLPIALTVAQSLEGKLDQPVDCIQTGSDSVEYIFVMGHLPYVAREVIYPPGFFQNPGEATPTPTPAQIKDVLVPIRWTDATHRSFQFVQGVGFAAAHEVLGTPMASGGPEIGGLQEMIDQAKTSFLAGLDSDVRSSIGEVLSEGTIDVEDGVGRVLMASVGVDSSAGFVYYKDAGGVIQKISLPEFDHKTQMVSLEVSRSGENNERASLVLVIKGIDDNIVTQALAGKDVGWIKSEAPPVSADPLVEVWAKAAKDPSHQVVVDSATLAKLEALHQGEKLQIEGKQVLAIVVEVKIGNVNVPMKMIVITSESITRNLDGDQVISLRPGVESPERLAKWFMLNHYSLYKANHSDYHGTFEDYAQMVMDSKMTGNSQARLGKTFALSTEDLSQGFFDTDPLAINVLNETGNISTDMIRSGVPTSRDKAGDAYIKYVGNAYDGGGVYVDPKTHGLWLASSPLFKGNKENSDYWVGADFSSLANILSKGTAWLQGLARGAVLYSYDQSNYSVLETVKLLCNDPVDSKCFGSHTLMFITQKPSTTSGVSLQNYTELSSGRLAVVFQRSSRDLRPRSPRTQAVYSSKPIRNN